MGDEATVSPEIYFEPVTWALHNKIVDLADEPLRGKGDGNYIPALQEAFNQLVSQKLDENCANFLFFLSDGRPSDGFRGRSGGHVKVKKQILNTVGAICAKFKSHLTFGAFGFAKDEGNIFELMKEMVQEAKN